MPTISDSPWFTDRRASPWLHIFRAGGLAWGWPQLLISFLAVVVYLAGLILLSSSLPANSILQEIRLRPPQLVVLQQEKEGAGTIVPLRPENPLRDSLTAVLLPWNSLSLPLKQLMFDPPAIDGEPSQRFGTLLTLVWGVAVWSFFGTATCRAVAHQMADERSASLPQCAQFAGLRWRSAVGAPCIPGLMIAFLALGLIAVAWFGRLPFVGTPIMTVMSPVLFAAGLAGACFALIIFIGWPLMVAAVAVDDCDAFGSLSRAYSFVTGRPAFALVSAFISGLTAGFLTLLLGGICVAGLMFLSRFLVGPLGNAERWAAVMSGAHLTARILLATFAVSLFWSLATINYLLLRQAVDGKPLEDISSGADESRSRGERPIVGIAATDAKPILDDQPSPISEAETVSPVPPT